MRIQPAAIITFAFLIACAPDRPDATGPNASLGAVSRNGVPFNEGLASPAWQKTAGNLVSQASYAAVQATHVYPILGVAEYLAVQRAEAAIGHAGGRKRLETDRGAVAGASVVTLSYLFPARAQALEDSVTAQANAGPGQPHPAFAAGEAIGRAVGAEIVARSRGDKFDAPNTATPPAGPGYWTSSANPPQPVAGGTLPGVTPWFLTSADQFRPGPPPAFGGAAFNAALAEIRQISDTRTTRQTEIAAYWALSNGTPTTAGFWLDVASQGIAEHALSEREATHLYALLSATMFDSQIGCWDAKLTYWLIRPWKADLGISVVAAVGKPNHPSYPSGHSCLSASGAEVLKLFFPEKSAQLDAMVIEAGLSRMYGGIHYRFDIDAGQTLGRSVARFTIAADRSGHSVLTAHDRDEHDGDAGERQHRGDDQQQHH
ncbi:MAG TPA: vanadium-dependent haloperoxidase [Gemmatimonadaceae bacterium]|nr:vanadium-dependent haloperoxidase [Gemmatimonadaceae bacterium]